jgi:hypothetical protein
LRDLRFREVIATHRPPLAVRPNDVRATVNCTAASWSSTMLTFVPALLLPLSTLEPLLAARNDFGDTVTALTVTSGGSGGGGSGVVTTGVVAGGGHPFSVPATVAH